MAEGNSYHVNHYCCNECDLELAGHSYVRVNHDHPVCLVCFDQKHVKECQACKKKILVTQQGVNLYNQHWHATPRCFKCVICNTCLIGKKISVKKDSLLCSSKCIVEFNAMQ